MAPRTSPFNNFCANIASSLFNSITVIEQAVLLLLLLLTTIATLAHAAEVSTNNSQQQDLRSGTATPQPTTFAQLLTAKPKQQQRITTMVEAKKRAMMSVSVKLLRNLKSKIKRELDDMQDKIHNLKSSIKSKKRTGYNRRRLSSLTGNLRKRNLPDLWASFPLQRKKMFDKHSRDFVRNKFGAKLNQPMKGYNHAAHKYQRQLYKQRMHYERALDEQRAVNNELISIILANESD